MVKLGVTKPFPNWCSWASRVKSVHELCSLENGWTFEDVFSILGGGFKYFLFSPLPGEMIHFD